MATYVTIVGKLKTILLEATGVGTLVYDYERHARDWSTFLGLFKTGSLIKGWEITRTSWTEEGETNRTNKKMHRFTMRGYYSLDDSEATEKTFQGLLDNIATSFRNEITLDGEVLQCEPVQVPIIQNRMFGSVLCHFVEMYYDVTEEIQWVDP